MKDAESGGKKQRYERDDVLVSPYFENTSECKCSMEVGYTMLTVKSRLLTPTAWGEMYCNLRP